MHRGRADHQHPILGFLLQRPCPGRKHVCCEYLERLPALSTAGFSQPFQRLWSQTYGPGDYAPPINVGTGNEHFYDEFTGLQSPESNVWLYSFDLFPTNPFCQLGKGTIYWVSVASIAPPAAFLQWGWKTSTNHWFDAGVYGKVDPVSGNLLVPWQPLHNPLSPTPTPIDFAFQISSGPPTPNCDPALGGAGAAPRTFPLTAWMSGPSHLSRWGTISCARSPARSAGSLSGVRGLRIRWIPMPRSRSAFGRICPLWLARVRIAIQGRWYAAACFIRRRPRRHAALRYRYRQYAANLQENFFNPTVPALLFVGLDTQIWRYDFFPFVPSCFVQDGGPFANGRTYWLTVSYLPQTPGGGNYTFGWKTSTKHWQDAAVYGSGLVPATWNPMFDPRNGAQLDLAKVIWKFPVKGINKDMVNTTTATADGIQIILMGPHLITWHYDGSPPWTSFLATTDAAGNTVLQWSGGVTVPPGGITHVGFETPGAALPPVLAWNWLSGGAVIGPALQVNAHLLGDPSLVLVNDFYTNSVMLASGTVEFYATPPPLDQMVVGGSRSPISTSTLTLPQGLIMPGGAASINVPTGPATARFALFVINLDDSSGHLGATDFLLASLDAAQAPILQSVGVSGGNITIGWSSVYGRSYQLQSRNALTGSGSWANVGSSVMALGGETSITIPVGSSPSHYRVTPDAVSSRVVPCGAASGAVVRGHLPVASQIPVASARPPCRDRTALRVEGGVIRSIV